MCVFVYVCMCVCVCACVCVCVCVYWDENYITCTSIHITCVTIFTSWLIIVIPEQLLALLSIQRNAFESVLQFLCSIVRMVLMLPSILLRCAIKINFGYSLFVGYSVVRSVCFLAVFNTQLVSLYFDMLIFLAAPYWCPLLHRILMETSGSLIAGDTLACGVSQSFSTKGTDGIILISM